MKLMKFIKGNMGRILFFLYIIVVLRITVFRSDFSLAGFMQNGQINLSLFEEYVPIIRDGRWFTFIYLFVGNIIWFVPFGMYLEHGKKVKKAVWILLAGLLFSLLIEGMQYAFGTGYSELDDLILNAFGVGIGVLCVRMWKRLISK